MQPAAEDIDSGDRMPFDNYRSAAIFIMSGADQFLPLHVFKVAWGNDDLLPLAHVMSRLHEHLFLADVMMVPFAVFHLLKLISIRHPRMHFAIFCYRSNPDSLAYGPIGCRHPYAIHMINNDRITRLRTNLGINNHAHAKIRNVRMGSGQARRKAQNGGAGGVSVEQTASSVIRLAAPGCGDGSEQYFGGVTLG
jgi:hypothetical protein